MGSLILFGAVRTVFFAFFAFTSLFCLLAFVPFTYQEFHKAGLFPSLRVFAAVHHWLHLLVALAGLASLALDRPHGAPLPRASRWGRRLFTFWMITQSLLLLPSAVVGRLENNGMSFLWAVLALAPLVLLAVLDWCDGLRAVKWSEQPCPEDAAVFRAAWQSALFLALVSTAWAYIRVGGGQDWSAGAGVFAAGWNLLSHILVLMMLFTALNLLVVISGWLRAPAKWQFVLCHLFGAAIFWLVARSVVFAAISFQGWRADLYAGTLALTLAGLLSGATLRANLWRPLTVDSGLAMALWIRRPAARSTLHVMVSLALTGALGGAILLPASRMDWNFLVQKLLVLAIWVLVFRICYQQAFATPALRRRSFAAVFAVLAVLAGYRSMQAAQRTLWRVTNSSLRSDQFLDKYSGYDVSFRLAREIVTPRVHVDPEFYAFLTRNTNLPRSAPAKPVDVNIVEDLRPGQTPRPNIFVIVIDSLRADYLSPYNSAVEFTPNIGEFGKDSAVFERAFSHYGGTGLSEPSIWVGGMMLHKQYVTPFSPMNALQKLLEVEGYRAFISRDTILQTVVTPWKNFTPLDAKTSHMDYDLCRSLGELEGKIAAEGYPKSGVFAYTQPLNIHIARINQEGGKPIDDHSYGAFYSPYASRLRRIDGCFGNFLQFLKQHGLYEDSIVVLTADHGDSLGEDGRWGHAYTIYPEVIRVPLLFHLPQAMRSLHHSPKIPAFSTDITPSLYYLLGHRPVLKHQFQGRPLFTERPEEQGAYRRNYYLVASSYAAVYGVLSGDGTRLFISDGVNYRDSVFDLSSYAGSGSRAPSSVRSEFQSLIREEIESLANWYGVPSH
ncbi:MAG: sulfatase-like hydrolase/transferase [Bryobacterales bacterium]|nr:sulfatase-like hydrolase/transferase [Bryobacterales bacterium]